MYEQVSAAAVATGVQPGSVKSYFNATLYKPVGTGGSRQPWQLELELRVNLKQRNPDPWPTTTDANDTPFWIDRWTPSEWANFKLAAQHQAEVWDGQFWLKPPPTFADGDEPHVGGRASVWRPNVYCMFKITLTENPRAAHRSIEVAKLNYVYAQQVASTRGHASPDSGTFTSHSMLWDSLDTTPRVIATLDISGRRTTANQNTVTHEIGHSLGLAHIGVLRKAPLCQIAMMLGWPNASSNSKVQQFIGGSNANVCYGDWYVDSSLGDDIMGSGGTFSEADGLPWVWAMRQLRNRPNEDWQVLLQREHAENGSFVLK